MDKSDRNFLITMIIIGVIVIGGISFLIGFAIHKDNQFNAWYDSLTPEEQMAYQQEQAEKRESMRDRYEVTSVSQYIGTTTNQFGGVTDTYTAYTFTYLRGNKLNHVESFRHYEYGLTKVVIGDKNEYVIDHYNDIQYLVLTKETLANIKVNQ